MLSRQVSRTLARTVPAATTALAATDFTSANAASARMTQASMIASAQRHRVWTALAATAVACLVWAAIAAAATDHYCDGCWWPPQTYHYDHLGLPLTLSYMHYIGGGNRDVGAGAFSTPSPPTVYGSIWSGTNTATHSYAGVVTIFAVGTNNDPNNNLTGDAHADY